jgi:hypothetical protein
VVGAREAQQARCRAINHGVFVLRRSQTATERRAEIFTA